MNSLKPQQLLRIDALAGALGGLVVLSLSPFLAELTRVSRPILFVQASCGFLYAAAALFFSANATRAPRFLKVMSLANAGYASLSVLLMLWLWSAITNWGVIYFCIEATIIFSLAVIEWRTAAVTSEAH